MKEDALERRTFSNIVAEFSTDLDPDHPLKVIGGHVSDGTRPRNDVNGESAGIAGKGRGSWRGRLNLFLRAQGRAVQIIVQVQRQRCEARTWRRCSAT